MRHNMKNVVRLLEAMEANSNWIHRRLKKTAPDCAEVQRRRSELLQEIIWLMKDEQFFNDIAEVYGVTEE